MYITNISLTLTILQNLPFLDYVQAAAKLSEIEPSEDKQAAAQLTTIELSGDGNNPDGKYCNV